MTSATGDQAGLTGARFEHRALLADGTAIVVRRLGPGDRAAVEALHRDLPANDAYLRFFTVSAASPGIVADLVVRDDVVALGALRGDRLLGVAHYRREPAGRAPEIAIAVAHDAQHRGVASLLLEHLVAVAVAEGVTRLSAEVLSVNHEMLRVIRDSGLGHRLRPDGDVEHVELDVTDGLADQRLLDSMLYRQERADVASLRSVLAPRSLVVVGAGRKPGSVGTMVLRTILDAGFAGAVHVVHPSAASVAGLGCHRSVAELPGEIDLAVLAVPAPAVPEVAEDCGRRGIRALLVLSSGVTGELAERLAGVAARYGMRVVGPNCLGAVNTDRSVRLAATFGRTPGAGRVGIAAQSGGVVIGLSAELDRLGLGVSTALSVGDALDVNGDDMLLWWGADGRTRAAVLYVESVRRPAQFAAIARRLARRMPVLAVRSGTSEVGRRAAASHSAATATPGVVREALFARAGVLAVDSLAEVGEGLAVLCGQPVPGGDRVAVVSNAGGGGVLAVDACTRHGLRPAELSPSTRAALGAVLPPAASVTNPVDTTATVPAPSFRRAIELLRADPAVDAVLAVGVCTGAGDPLAELAALDTRSAGTPLVAVRLGQASAVELPTPGSAAVFADPSTAARALSLAVRRARWLATADRPMHVPAGVDPEAARRVVAAHPDVEWLPPLAAVQLLGSAGLPVAPVEIATTCGAAVRACRQAGGPVALKADASDLLHKSRAGGVWTGLDSAREVRQAYRELRRRFGGRLRGVVVQPMAPPGAELLVGVTSHPPYGPLLTIGLGGTTTDLVGDRAHCLLPATEAELDATLDRLRVAPRLFAGAGGAAIRDQLRDAARRLAWLATRAPEVAETEINPLLAGPTGASAVDIRVRLAPARPAEPWLRGLPT
ncbi:bifunctional GNAT family N-acetyltransferase/acetate--CoA ligase family protein [Pseudonocardia acaciae]|uniref:bifunctional acetate--CoA ligase family protein/GNAT family N-acetyltransferase n=1 Tax=Pseudonocardia acaciae TaxID=551276 RepID=UPI000561A2C5|nr:bifunctional GNAT family N-acetyltransferase/acetate--CoA ligase family protein [Pseudonocardia acaciae]